MAIQLAALRACTGEAPEAPEVEEVVEEGVVEEGSAEGCETRTISEWRCLCPATTMPTLMHGATTPEATKESTGESMGRAARIIAATHRRRGHRHDRRRDHRRACMAVAITVWSGRPRRDHPRRGHPTTTTTTTRRRVRRSVRRRVWLRAPNPMDRAATATATATVAAPRAGAAAEVGAARGGGGPSQVAGAIAMRIRTSESYYARTNSGSRAKRSRCM